MLQKKMRPNQGLIHAVLRRDARREATTSSAMHAAYHATHHDTGHGAISIEAPGIDETADEHHTMSRVERAATLFAAAASGVHT